MNRTGASKMNGARTVEGQWAWQAKMAAGTQPAEQALQANTAGGSPPGSGLKTNGPQLAGFAATTAAR